MKIKILSLLSILFFLLTSGYAREKEDTLAGITLGWSKVQVKKILGEPQNVSELESDSPDIKQVVWEYKKGIKILFSNDYVEVIIIKSPCNIPTPRGLYIGDTWRKALDLYRHSSAYVQNMGYEIGIVFTLQEDVKLSISIPSDKEEIMTISIWREEPINSEVP